MWFPFFKITQSSISKTIPIPKEILTQRKYFVMHFTLYMSHFLLWLIGYIWQLMCNTRTSSITSTFDMEWMTKKCSDYANLISFSVAVHTILLPKHENFHDTYITCSGILLINCIIHAIFLLCKFDCLLRFRLTVNYELKRVYTRRMCIRHRIIYLPFCTHSPSFPLHSDWFKSSSLWFRSY